MTQSSQGGLIAQIQRLMVLPGQLALWSLGQAGFVIKGGETRAYIDPIGVKLRKGKEKLKAGRKGDDKASLV